jgi:hypothetical protein
MHKYTIRKEHGFNPLCRGILPIVLMGFWGSAFVSVSTAGYLPFPGPNPIASVPTMSSPGHSVMARADAAETTIRPVARKRFTSRLDFQGQGRVPPRTDSLAILSSRRIWVGMGRG